MGADLAADRAAVDLAAVAALVEDTTAAFVVPEVRVFTVGLDLARDLDMALDRDTTGAADALEGCWECSWRQSFCW